MRFEVYGVDKKRKFVTESEKCMPDDKTLREMKAAGYTFLRDGKDRKSMIDVWNNQRAGG